MNAPNLVSKARQGHCLGCTQTAAQRLCCPTTHLTSNKGVSKKALRTHPRQFDTHSKPANCNRTAPTGCRRPSAQLLVLLCTTSGLSLLCTSASASKSTVVDLNRSLLTCAMSWKRQRTLCSCMRSESTLQKLQLLGSRAFGKQPSNSSARRCHRPSTQVSVGKSAAAYLHLELYRPGRLLTKPALHRPLKPAQPGVEAFGHDLLADMQICLGCNFEFEGHVVQAACRARPRHATLRQMPTELSIYLNKENFDCNPPAETPSRRDTVRNACDRARVPCVVVTRRVLLDASALLEVVVTERISGGTTCYST